MVDNNTAAVQVMKIQDFDVANAEVSISPVSFSNYIRALMQNWRQGTVACKDRGEVISRSNKKPWKQKGTGRARAGSARSPLWRGGGVTFGPQERTRTLKTSKALRTNVFNALFVQKLNAGSVVSLDWTLLNKPKTSEAYAILKQHNMHDKKIAFFVMQEDYNVHASLNNLNNVRMMLFDQPNAYALIHADCWVFLQKDGNSFKEMVKTWI
ncbi:MAG: 50S ribosomal protein L4 [Candidatus Babeliaceae bacterium]|jgi:large subunit ribosomal protein L4